MTEKPTRYCSFCGTSQHDRRFLVSGNGGALICDHCIKDVHRMLTRHTESLLAEVRENGT